MLPPRAKSTHFLKICGIIFIYGLACKGFKKYGRGRGQFKSTKLLVHVYEVLRWKYIREEVKLESRTDPTRGSILISRIDLLLLKLIYPLRWQIKNAFIHHSNYYNVHCIALVKQSKGCFIGCQIKNVYIFFFKPKHNSIALV